MIYIAVHPDNKDFVLGGKLPTIEMKGDAYKSIAALRSLHGSHIMVLCVVGNLNDLHKFNEGIRVECNGPNQDFSCFYVDQNIK